MFVYLEKDTENGCKREICDINEQSQGFNAIPILFLTDITSRV